jgi:tRNA 2-thiouridine synthesizing protein A
MNAITTVDARGLSCPQPALLTKQTIDQLTQGRLEVLVDSGTSRDNVARTAEKAGWRVTSEETPEGGFHLVLEK